LDARGCDGGCRDALSIYILPAGGRAIAFLPANF
jgi:hypothetical protein